jgi:endonuclease YncB( thermonuclease family)
MMKHVSSLLPLVIVALLAGCTNYDGIYAQSAQLETQVAELELKVERLKGVEARVVALETSPAANEASGERITLLEAQALKLEAQVRALGSDLAELTARVRQTKAATPPAPRIGAPPGEHAPPKAGVSHDVLSVGSGSLLLVRTGGKLERVRLIGVDAPLRFTKYQQQPERLRRHLAAFADLPPDGTFDGSREHLESLLAGQKIVLSYPAGSPKRAGDRSLLVYASVPAGPGSRVGVSDLGAEMIRSGFALAEGKHPKSASYEALERDARLEGAGLLSLPK